MKNLRTFLTVLAGLSATMWLSEREARAQRYENLVYGNTYSLQNGRDDTFLDTRGSGCNGDDLCVSTATSPNRSNGSGQWQVLSASGDANGSFVNPGDKVYLLNLWNGNGGYLDTDGSGCQGEDLCVSTSTSSNRDQNSGTWTVNYQGLPFLSVLTQMPVSLQNAYSGGGYLETKGSGCQSNADCVVTSSTFLGSAARMQWSFADAGTTFTDWQRGTYGGNPQSRSDLFCYSTLSPQTILQEDAASLVWDEYGNLTLTNFETGSTHVWGMSASAPLTSPTTTATVCFESDGNLRIRDNAGEIAWQSGTKASSDGNFLSLADCTLRGQHTAGTKWAIQTERCNLTKRDDWGGAGWCFNRSTSNDMPILWSDTGLEADWQTDGDLVLYSDGMSVARTNNALGAQVCFGRAGHPGQLEVLDGNGNELFASATDPSSTPGTDYLEADPCSISLHRPDPSYEGDRIYYSAMPGISGCSLTALAPGWCRETTAPTRLLDNGTAHLDWQADGNLVLYLESTGQALWATNTSGTGGRLCYQTDQNLVVYSAAGGPSGRGGALWSSGTYGQPASQLTLLGCSPQIATVAGDQVLATLASPAVCGNPVAGGGFSYSFDDSWGNSDFGAEVWTVAAATNAAAMSNLVSSLSGSAQAEVEALLPSSSPPASFAEVMGDAGVSATLFSQNFTVLEVGGFVNPDPLTPSSLNITVMGNVHSLTLGAATDYNVTQTFFSEEEEILVGGVVPVTVSADVTGTIDVPSSLTSGVDPNSGNNNSYSLVGSVTPSANLTISASVGVGTSGFSAGVEGSLTLVDVSVPLGLDLDATSRSYDAYANLNISTLDGDLSLYAEADLDLGLFTIDEEYTYGLASWNGYTYSQTLLNNQGGL